MEKQILQEIFLEYHPKTSFTVISKGRVVRIEFDEVTHVRKFGYETIIYTIDREYRTKYSLQDIMNELPVNDFFRVHKSHIVSLKHTNSIKRSKIRIGDLYLQVSNYYRIQMIKRLGEILEQRYSWFKQV